MYTFQKDITKSFSQLTLQVMGENLEKRRLFSGLTDEEGFIFASIRETFVGLTGHEMVFGESNTRLPSASANTTSHTYFRLVTSLLGDTPIAWDSQYFHTFQAAVAHFKKEYTERKEGDGHDAYWNNIPLRIQSVTTVITSLY